MENCIVNNCTTYGNFWLSFYLLSSKLDWLKSSLFVQDFYKSQKTYHRWAQKKITILIRETLNCELWIVIGEYTKTLFIWDPNLFDSW